MPVDYKLLTKILVTKSVNWPRIRFVSRPLVRDEVARLFSAVCGDRAHTQMRLAAHQLQSQLEDEWPTG